MDDKTFLDDQRTYDAVVRNLAVIGEAVKQIPEYVRTRYPDVEWRKVAGLRDVVVHGYFGIDPEVLWDVVQRRIPELLQQVRRILSDLPP